MGFLSFWNHCYGVYVCFCIAKGILSGDLNANIYKWLWHILFCVLVYSVLIYGSPCLFACIYVTCLYQNCSVVYEAVEWFLGILSYNQVYIVTSIVTFGVLYDFVCFNVSFMIGVSIKLLRHQNPYVAMDVQST